MAVFPPWVIGLGSDHGDDQAGWKVIEQLRRSRPNRVQSHASHDPLAIADLPEGCPLLIVVDACCGAGEPGSIHRFEWPDSRLDAAFGESSHGLGLASALRLMEALGKLPQRVVIFAIEAESREPGTILNKRIDEAIPAVVSLVLAEIGGKE